MSTTNSGRFLGWEAVAATELLFPRAPSLGNVVIGQVIQLITGAANYLVHQPISDQRRCIRIHAKSYIPNKIQMYTPTAESTGMKLTQLKFFQMGDFTASRKHNSKITFKNYISRLYI